MREGPDRTGLWDVRKRQPERRWRVLLPAASPGSSKPEPSDVGRTIAFAFRRFAFVV